MAKGTEMHPKPHLPPGVCRKAETAWRHMAAHGKGLKKSPEKCCGNFEEAEIAFGS